MDESTYKSLGWRDNTKRDRTPSWQWVRRMVNKSYTSQEWTEMFKNLPDRDKWRILQDVNPVPKENINKNEGLITVRVVSEGVRPVKEIEGEIVQDTAELPPGNDE